MTTLRILIFHGYLLHGTGSNIYNANLARTLVEMGHEVHLFCQDRKAEQLEFVDSVATVSGGNVQVKRLRESAFAGSCTVYRPEIGDILPVYVADRYDGFEARTFDRLSDKELSRYLEANVEAVRAVAEAGRLDLALANHLVMGPLILARALGDSIGYAVKIHGSALEYTVAPNPRFLPHAREGLAKAREILVGSRHIEERLVEVVGNGGLMSRISMGPPGVDTGLFAPATKDEAAAGLEELSRAVPLGPIDLERDRLAVFVGKLIVSKGVEILLAAWPYVISQNPEAKLLIVGFGGYRDALERLRVALSQGDRGEIDDIARRGRELEGGSPDRLVFLSRFLSGLSREDEGHYFEMASALGYENIRFLGKLGHGQLAKLLPASEVMAVPSTYPEAFGMVAAEAAACGVWPVVARHSGLAEVTSRLGESLPKSGRDLLSFSLEGDAVRELAARLNGWFGLPGELRGQLAASIRVVAERLWSWEGVARGVIEAARGGPDRAQ